MSINSSPLSSPPPMSPTRDSSVSDDSGDLERSEDMDDRSGSDNHSDFDNIPSDNHSNKQKRNPYKKQRTIDSSDDDDDVPTGSNKRGIHGTPPGTYPTQPRQSISHRPTPGTSQLPNTQQPRQHLLHSKSTVKNNVKVSKPSEKLAAAPQPPTHTPPLQKREFDEVHERKERHARQLQEKQQRDKEKLAKAKDKTDALKADRAQRAGLKAETKEGKDGHPKLDNTNTTQPTHPPQQPQQSQQPQYPPKTEVKKEVKKEIKEMPSFKKNKPTTQSPSSTSGKTTPNHLDLNDLFKLTESNVDVKASQAAKKQKEDKARGEDKEIRRRKEEYMRQLDYMLQNSTVHSFMDDRDLMSEWDKSFTAHTVPYPYANFMGMYGIDWFKLGPPGFSSEMIEQYNRDNPL
ncbi:hypothetical protein E3P86_03197 [Wallemia ichthyophaga]|uniref:Uncharacterized protein n=1 Tax=Wallemia ichthyophaga TaxID=245174 RepID=A0A4T0IQM8_WALIC|nr:hypothetical protein E3P86_03197 [Wallemia ichthyophaga]